MAGKERRDGGRQGETVAGKERRRQERRDSSGKERRWRARRDSGGQGEMAAGKERWQQQGEMAAASSVAAT